MDIVIRPAVPGDAAELNRLNTAFNGPGPVTDASIALSLRGNGQERVFVTACGEGLVGFSCVQLFRSFCYDTGCAEITELFVDEQHRGKGIAARLVEVAERHCPEGTVGRFQLLTGSRNVPAQRLYERLGYLKTEEILYRKSRS